jgi:hypothetical protein
MIRLCLRIVLIKLLKIKDENYIKTDVYCRLKYQGNLQIAHSKR